MLEDIRSTGETPTQRRATATLSSFLTGRGDKAKARSLLNTVSAHGNNDHHVAYSIGATFAQLGDVPAALLWLRRAKDRGFPCYPWYRQDKLIAPLQNQEGFKALLADLAKEWAHMKDRYSQTG